MKQNRICFLAAAAAVLLGTAACDKTKEKEFDPNDPAVFTIAPQPDSQAIQAEGGDLVFTFDAPDYWFVSSPVDWLSFEPESGKPGPVTLTVKSKQNIKGERNALVTVTAKKQRGKFTVTQKAWPYYHEWALYGTIGGSSTDRDITLEDQANQLVWGKERVAFHTGETFTFRMSGSDATVLGLNGELALVPDSNHIYTGSLKKGGDKITLPFDGYWDVTLDVELWTVTVALAERYPWSLVGTIAGGDWNTDIDMTDKGDQLIWEAARIPFHQGEQFKFRREKDDAVNVGGAGGFEPVEGYENRYVATIKADGDALTLPADGYWTMTLDLNTSTVTASLVQLYPWSIYGTIAGGDWDTDIDMTDMSHQLVWEAARVPYHEGEAFKFRREKNNAVTLGISGDFVPEGTENTYVATLAADGGEITLPAEGYWSLHMDLNTSTLTATLVEEFPRVHAGVFWENDDPEGHGSVSWNSTYRFALDGMDGQKEAITTLPAEVWEKVKTEPFYVVLKGENPQIRVTTGWWSGQWGDDITPGNELLKDNGDGTWTLRVDLSGAPDFVANLDQQHLLLTGDRYTPLGIYPENAWANDGTHGAISWNSTYRFGLEGNDGNNECITTFPATIWNKLKTETFYVDLEATDPQIRVTTGWWSGQWGDDVTPGDERLKDNGDGTFTLTVNLTGDPIVDLLDQQHFLLTGDRYKPLRIRFQW